MTEDVVAMLYTSGTTSNQKAYKLRMQIIFMPVNYYQNPSI